MNNFLSQRSSMIDASGIRKVFDLAAQLKDPINFSIGLPDFDVPEKIKTAAADAIEQGKNRYSLTAGIPELREKISREVCSMYGWDNADTLVASGVSGGLLLTFLATIDPGDEVIVPDPYFVIYKHIINVLGGKCVYLDTYPDFQIDPEKLEDKITDRTKIIILNSPSNPTGAVYSEECVKAVAEIANRRDILIMSDEIYDKFSYSGRCPSAADYSENTILMKGFSKSYAMTGWRMAYVSVQEKLKGLLNEMTKFQQYTFVCAPTPFQYAALEAMDCDISDKVASYARKRDMLFEGLKGKFEITKPEGAFYMFPKAPGMSGSEFVEKAIENNVLIIPGSVFSEKDTHFRISYATSDEKIKQGIDILNSIV
ncbi:pyridoxal phosphate-dependent aminotransferase [Sedimentisphaera salicampi]|uniref:Aminotransferase n=1 Tax=Sedimentisphaera salicampi TaxID=1941349 RepID=A0A1W6LQ53_9BACT|nr:aminotransferase class I/II-fold pyridoxal phosphate-dependent enzyme [Sedimentisphaera salicampi]ARN57904.1 Aspartate aminotransferase [Sedimentisphaera salicampi]OXU14072.1 Aspartate aminotransferase [Sedimentisphaera salicampi]